MNSSLCVNCSLLSRLILMPQSANTFGSQTRCRNDFWPSEWVLSTKVSAKLHQKRLNGDPFFCALCSLISKIILMPKRYFFFGSQTRCRMIAGQQNEFEAQWYQAIKIPAGYTTFTLQGSGHPDTIDNFNLFSLHTSLHCVLKVVKSDVITDRARASERQRISPSASVCF